MTKIRMVLLGILGIGMAAVLPLAQAQNVPGPDGSPQKHFGLHIQEIYNQLNLTDDQKKQLEANKEDHRAKMELARQALKSDKEAIHQELMKAQLDMPKITVLHEEIKTVLSQIEDEKLSSILAVRAILTPEQFLKFVTLMHKHKEEHEEESEGHQN